MREVEYLEYSKEYCEKHLKQFIAYSYEKIDELTEAFDYVDEGLRHLKIENCLNKNEINK